jgi:hypothetical protein
MTPSRIKSISKAISHFKEHLIHYKISIALIFLAATALFLQKLETTALVDGVIASEILENNAEHLSNWQIVACSTQDDH